MFMTRLLTKMIYSNGPPSQLAMLAEEGVTGTEVTQASNAKYIDTAEPAPPLYTDHADTTQTSFLVDLN